VFPLAGYLEPTYIECGICREWFNCSDERLGPLLLRFEGVDDVLQVAVLLSHVARLYPWRHANCNRSAFTDGIISVKRKASEHLHEVLAALPPFHIRRSMEFLCVLLRAVAWLCLGMRIASAKIGGSNRKQTTHT
jgi:hypothetical protein